MGTTDPRAAPSLIESVLLWGSIAVGLVFVAIGVPVLGLGFDEAWILGSAFQVAEDGGYGFMGQAGPISTGGLYVLVHSLVAATFGDGVVLARALSAGFALAAGYELYRLHLDLGHRRASIPYVLAAVLAVPGSLTLPALAFGAPIALWATLAGLRLGGLARRGPLSVPALVGCAFLLGLAMATRLQFALLWPVVVTVLWWTRGADPEWRRRLLALGGAAIVFVLSVLVLQRMAAVVPVQHGVDVGRVGGLLAGLDWERWLKHVVVLNRLLPLAVVAALAAIVVAPGKGTGRAPSVGLVWVGLLVGVILLWTLIVKLPHLRYLWPAVVPVVAIAVGRTLHWVDTRDPGQRRFGRVAILVVLLCGLGSNGLAAGRHLLIGDSNYFHWETAGDTALHERRWPASRLEAQREMARYVRELGPQTRVVSAGLPGMEVGLLARRAIPMARSVSEAERPGVTHLLVGPDIGGLYARSDRLSSWLTENAEIERQAGRHTLFRLAAELPEFELRRHAYRPPR